MTDKERPQSVKDLFEYISSLEEARDLLKEIYMDLDPYGSTKTSTALKIKIQNYFNFDDSE